MTGLDLESFLLLLRADPGAWALGALVAIAATILVWVSWGSRNAIRKCLALSVAGHALLLVGGGSVPAVIRVLHPRRADDEPERHVRVAPVVEPVPGAGAARAFAAAGGDGPRAGFAAIDRLDVPVALATERLAAERPAVDPASLPVAPEPTPREAPALAAAALAAPELPPPTSLEPAATPIVASPTPPEAIVGAGDLALDAPEPPEPPRPPETEAPKRNVPLGDARLRSGRPRPRVSASAPPVVELGAPKPAPAPLAAVPLRAPPVAPPAPALAELAPKPSEAIAKVPEIYRPRLDADRSTRAQRAGASKASEQAVERALDWLARHQDADGRWDGGVARYSDGEAVEGDDDFTVHCPEDDVCRGECAYWEADSGLTALALLTYLGAGHTHKEGEYARVIARGLTFLIRLQKPDGDLRGSSQTVGMYCHAMATLALCEGYALSRDERLRGPAERAVAFLARARAADGQSWRYAPGAAVGDTSILGWVVMALKSARESGLPIPNRESLERGAASWLDRVSDGDSKGLAKYQPADKVTPTMTAEAWVCRQFLGFGGPGPASAEAAAFLLEHESDKGETNVYYWYYATLAMYQHGGKPWSEWNARLRDRLIALQRDKGHALGSWDPDASIYGSRGGRIYCTALATLSLEVYYRYLRLYDAPNLADDDDADELPAPAPPLLEAPVKPR